MSFVSVVVCKDYLSVVADSRTTALYENNELREIVDEDFEKINTLSDNAFLCLTGKVEDGERFIDESRMIANILKDKKIKSDYEIKLWYKNVKPLILTDYFFEIKFGGLSIDNTFQVYNISSKENDIQKLSYGDDSIGFNFSGGMNVQKDLPKSIFIKLYQSLKEESLQAVRKIQEQLNDEIADLDPTVNKIKTYFNLIKKNEI